MLPKSLKGFPSKAIPFVMEKRFFMVGTHDSKYEWNQKGKEVVWDYIKDTIKPIFSDSDEGYLYFDPLSEKDMELIGKFERYLEKNRSRYKIKICEDLFDEDNLDFWVDWNESRGSIVWFSKYSEEKASTLFQNCFDPVALNNPAVYTGQSIINYTRKKMENEDGLMAFVLPYGVHSIFAFSADKSLESLYNTALNNCNYSDSFICNYGK